MRRAFYTFITVILAVGFFGCGAALPRHYDELDYRTQADIQIPFKKGHGTTAAFYATNRAESDGAIDRYSRSRSDKLHYGTCDIKVPRRHNIGSDIVTQQLSRAINRSRSQPLSVISVNPCEDKAEFFTAFNERLKERPTNDVLILVHGYQSDFRGPVARAAGLVYDLGEKIIPVAYCWTSQGTLQGYPHDENDVEAAARKLAIFIGEILDNTPETTRLHLVAHSMGARVATIALEKIKASRDFAEGPKPFKNIVFAAADIDAEEFAARMRDDDLKSLAERTTLYAAYNDRALEASERLHGRQYPRAGRAGEKILVISGVDTIDVSLNDASLLGHSYYGDNRAIIQDLFLVIVLRQSPEQRNLYHVDTDAGRYWLIRP